MQRETWTLKATIRNAKPSEANLLSKLAFESKAYWGYSSEFMESCREELSVTPEKINSVLFTYKVYETDNRILGFYAIEKLNDNESELEALFVKPEHIGSGIGRALMEHARDFAKNQRFLSLKIQGDPNAEAFYLASGAIRIGEHESASIKGRYLPIFIHYL